MDYSMKVLASNDEIWVRENQYGYWLQEIDLSECDESIWNFQYLMMQTFHKNIL